MRRIGLEIAGGLGLLWLASGVAIASDLAPTPQRSPREPVSRQALIHPNVPPSRTVEGAITIVDTERLRVGAVDLRLFGVVIPQLSASFGPQARGALDELSTSGVRCAIRDRDRDGRLLATCRGANDTDLALELLRRGLAVTARGSLRDTDLAVPYLMAEESAQNQKSGLWSGQQATATAPTAAPTPIAVEKTPVVAAPAPASPAAESTIAPQPEAKAPDAPASPVTEKGNDAHKPTKTEKTESLAPVLSVAGTLPGEMATPSWLERYQFVVTGALFLMAGIWMWAAASRQQRLRQQDELRTVAAALRGEMMSLRAVFLARLRATEDVVDKDIAWPRIRVLIFQAYVGRLGLLGAELARQVAATYGLASDYASYYASQTGKSETVSKRHAMRSILTRLEEVLPRLEKIEKKGQPSTASATFVKIESHKTPVAIPVAPTTALAPKVVKNAAPPAPKVSVQDPPPVSIAPEVPSVADVVVIAPPPSPAPATIEAVELPTKTEEEIVAEVVPEKVPETIIESAPPVVADMTASAETPPEVTPSAEVKPAEAIPSSPPPAPETQDAEPFHKVLSGTNPVAYDAQPHDEPKEVFPQSTPPEDEVTTATKSSSLWGSWRNRPTKKSKAKKEQDLAQIVFPDYTTLTDEELESLAYEEESLSVDPAAFRTRHRR